MAHTRTLWQRISPWQRAALALCAVAVALVQLSGSSAAVGATPDQVGQWTAPIAWPLDAVHMSLEPTGQVLAFDAWDNAPNSERLWDPASGTFTSVPYARNLFCAGHIQLADGRTLIVGGHINADFGLADTTIFNPATNTYFRGPDMSVGRWYPTATVLPDGRVLAFAGDNIVQNRPSQPHSLEDASVNSLPSIYNPKTNVWNDLTGATLTSPLYPQMFVLSDGRVFDAGPDTTTRILNTATSTWTTVGTSPIDGMSAVMYRPDKIMKSGSWADPDFQGVGKVYNSDAGTAVIDMGAATPTWRSTAPMNFARSYQNLTLLPDGTVLASGGMATSDGTDITQAVLPAEIWNPDTETWTTVASLTNGREYHSTALLLPDGRVLMAGGGRLPGRINVVDQTNAEIYSPPYLFKGARPTITSAPATVGWGSSFDVTTPNAGQVAKVSLIRSPSVTHAFDQNQRFQFLNFTAGAGKITVQAPANGNVAPPGDYMLFLLDANNVPSVASFVRVVAADVTPPSAPTGLGATVAGTTANLSWTASTDDTAVTGYNVHRGTTAGFAPTVANRIAQPTGTTYSDAGLAPGTYFYKVTAQDAAGNVSGPSNEITVTVGDTTPPSAPGTLTATAGTGQAILSWGAATDNVAVAKYDVYRSTTSGFTPTTANRIAQPATPGYTDTVAAGTYYYKVAAEDTGGNIGPTSNEASVTVTTVNVGLVAAYGFDAGSGTSAVDQSGNNNNGTLTNATWAGATAGKFGNALSFNGTNASVSVPDSNSLDLTTGMTVEAWVNPTVVANSWRTIVMKEQPGNLAWSLYGSNGSPNGFPDGYSVIGGVEREVAGTAQLPLSTWSHLALTYNGSAYTLYLNGVQVRTLATTGSLATSTSPLKIGGNAVWGEWFSGLIDEVRVYNRALSATEIQADMTRPVTNPDSTPPSAPTTLTATGGLSSAALNWSAATDNVAVVKYDVYRSTTSGFTPSVANRIAQPTGTSYTDSGLAGGTYYYRVAAEDAAGNIGGPSPEASATVGDTTPPSAPGTLTATGAIGTASLSWGAATDNVGVVGYSVYRSTTAGFVPGPTNLLAQPTGTSYVDTTSPGTYFYKVTARDAAGNAGAASNEATATVTADTTAPSAPTGLAAPITGSTANLTWTASTDNVGVVKYDVYRSTTSGFTPSTANRIAQPTGTSYSDTGLAIGTYYYKVAAEDAAGNISNPSNEANGTVADATAPTTPAGLAATVAGSTANLSWTASTDNVGVVRYNVHRSTTSGFTPSAANRIAQPTGTSYSDTGLAAGTYFYKVTAEDAAGNVSAASAQATATIADTTPPSTPAGLTANGGAGQATLNWGAATDNIGVIRYNLHRSTTSGFTPSAANRIAQPTGTSFTDNVAAGTYFYKVTAEDAAGNISNPSNEASAVVGAPPVTGLVAAYGFDEGSGTTTADQSGNNNNGTLSNATWAGAGNGKFGNALSFNGTNASVSIPDSNSLDLTTGMTLEAWVNPTSVSGFRTVLLKEQPGELEYSLYAGSDTNRPQQVIYSGSERILDGTASLPTGAWSHLAATYDGATMRLYVNGTQVSQLAVAGSIGTSTSPLKIGGNAIWGEWFSGLIDEVRVYNRALSATEIQGDMTRPLTNPDSTPPSAPATLTATGGLSSATLNWSASTDNVGVAKYDVYRSTTSGFTPSVANRIAQPTGTSYTDTVAAGTYYYKVAAEDGAGNISGSSPEASATVGDTTAPSAPGTLTATGAIGKATLSWGAATDNVGVTRYDVYRSTVAGFVPGPTNLIAQPTGTSYVDTTTPGTYFYRVAAEDAAGNIGAATNEASGTVTADTTAPSAPTGLAAPVTGSTANLTWTASTDDVGVLRYNVYRSTTSGFTPTTANRIAQPTGTSYSDTGLAIGTYYYKVTAEDAAGNVGNPSNEASATVADATPPSAPTGLAAPVTGSTANLTWTASTDNVGVTKYDVYRSTTSGFTPSAANRIAQPTGTSYNDTGLAAGTYYYKVTAEDAAGNVSAASAQATATVADTTAPSTPANLTATGGAGQAALNWSAATDNVGVIRYNVHRATTSGFTPSAANRIAQPTGTSYTNTGLAAGTYYYKVTAEDAAGNVSAASNQATAVVSTPPVTGLVAAYGFDEGSGSTTADQSGNNNNGTLNGTTWNGAGNGKYGNALTFNGTSSYVNVPDSNSLDLTNGITESAWVRPAGLGNYRTVMLKERPGDLSYSLYANTSASVPSEDLVVNGSPIATAGTSSLPIGSWTYLAATYDGTTMRLYVNGTQVSSRAVSGSVPTSANPFKIGGNSIWGEWFNGSIDEVRLYNRALSATEIQTDMNKPITPDTTPPTVSTRAPAPGSTGLGVQTSPTVTFSEPMDPASVTTATFEMRDPSNVQVPATVAYNTLTQVATLTPQAALRYGTTYTVIVHGPGGVTDTSGNAMAADSTWTFSTEANARPVLIVTSPTNKYTTFLGEILRNEGLNAYTSVDVGFLSATLLADFPVVVLGDTPLTAAQVTMLTNWVNSGGNLIAMHPDKQLAGLLGLTDAGTTLTNTYLKVDNTSAAGNGIVGSTIQFHGTADRYTLNGATAVASLYTNATTATTSPAVSWRTVGASGGDAVAFTYDLAKSVIQSRQGNPAWVGQNRDGFEGIAPDDLYFGARSGDVQPDWVDTSKIAIPQADEQQRLLMNLITLTARDRMPLPRFWYLPRGLKAVVTLTDDDHSTTNAPGGTGFRFDRLKQLSPANCVVANWECVRATSYTYPQDALTNAQAAGYVTDGFEFALHPVYGSCPTTVQDQSTIASTLASQLSSWKAKYTSIPSPVTVRNHCYYWPDYSTMAKVDLANGMRMSLDWAAYPGSWIGGLPGFMAGGGFPIRFADTDGTPINVWQEPTNLTDDGTTAAQTPAFIQSLLNNALGATGYYGAFGVLIHADNTGTNQALEDVVSAAQTRNVPIISSKQLLDWTDGRDNSTLRDLQWNAGTMTFSVSAATGANGLQVMLPTQGPSGTLTTITSGGSSVPFTTQTIKGIQYAFFTAVTGSYTATYA